MIRKLDGTESLQFRIHGTDAELNLEPRRLIVAGFTGRDPQESQRHVEELERIGIPIPEEIPTFYDLPVELLVMGDTFRVERKATSGEVEPVLFFAANNIYVTVGSDHTDRDLEKTDILAGKVACPKVVATSAIPYEEVKPVWDRIRIRSWVDGGKLYQDAKLSQLLPVDDLIESIAPETEDLNDLVLFLGTVPVVTDDLVFSKEFRAELSVPDPKLQLECHYRVLTGGT